MRRGSVLTWVAVVVAGCAAVAMPAQTASAQMRGGPGMNMRELLEPSITTHDLERMGEMLKLTEEQKTVANDLLAGFQAQYQEISSSLRETLDAARQEFQETRDQSVWRDLMKVGEKTRVKVKALETSFFSDLKAVLEPAQAERFPEYEMARRREKSLQQGFLSGENVDVVRLVEDVKLSAESRATIEPTLRQYATEIDRAATDRDEIYQSSMNMGMEFWQSGQMDKVNELFNKSREAGLKVRDINRKFARQVEGQLSDAERKKFTEEFLQRSFPTVYRKSYAENAIQTALKMNDLTMDQKSEIEGIAASYERDAGAANEKWAAAIEKSEKNRTIMQMFGAGMGNDEVRAAQQARRELDDKTLERVRGLLTEQQAAKLPERENRDWRREARQGN